MSFTKVTRATENINTGFGRFNTLIDDLASTSNAKGASQIGIEDTAGNMAATDVEAALAEIYTDTSSTRTLAEIFDEDSATTTGLTWGYKAGSFRIDNTITSVSAGTIGLTDDTTNYIEVDPSDGLVKKNTTGFTTARIPLRQVITASGSQDTSTDKRAWFSNPVIASTTTIGIVELSTDAEAVTGTSDVVVMTPGTTTAKLNDYTKDEDDMTSDSDSHICTQQSIKAYADLAVKIADTDVSSTGWVVDEDDMTSDLNTKVPTQQSVKAYVEAALPSIATTTQTGIVELATDAETIAGTATDKVCTPSNVEAALPSGVIVMWSGAISAIPTGWVICDGNNGTPNLTDRFVIHADADSGGTNDVGDTGGSNTIAEAQLPSHTHASGSLGADSDAHTHNAGTLSADSNGDHTHNYTISDGSAPPNTPGLAKTNGTLSSEATGADGAHTHTISGSTASDAHTHTVSGTSGSTGSGNDYKPKYYALAYIQKV